MNASGNILLVEDDFDLAGNLIDYFQGRGYQVTYARNGGIALHELVDHSFDLIILDVNLPGIDGFSLCSRLRREDGLAIPILMLTAASTLEDRLVGFDAGADDYLIKPFELKELEARIYALLRRSVRQVLKSETVRYGELSLDPSQFQAYYGGKRLELTTMGFRILLQLAKAAPSIVTRDELELALWRGEPPGSDALRSHIFTIRKELSSHGSGVELVTVRGVGYKICKE